MELIQTISILFTLSIPVAVIAVTYSCILTDADMILSRLYILSVEKLPMWLHKPLISCEKCVAGQIALWLFPFWILGQINAKYACPVHVYFIMQTIINTSIIKAVYYKIIGQAPKPMLTKSKKVKKPTELL